VNEKLWLGHFDLSGDDGVIMYRHAQLFRGAQGCAPEQLEDLLDIAITECNRFFPAFQSVLWVAIRMKKHLRLLCSIQ